MSRADRARPLRPPALLSFSVPALVARLSERFSPFRYALGEIRKAKVGGEQKEQNKKEQSRSSKRRGNPLLIFLQQGSNPDTGNVLIFFEV